MAKAVVKIDWNPKPYMDRIDKVMDKLEKEIAERVAEDAKRNLERWAPFSSGTLASEIEIIVSQFKKGGYMIVPQGPGNYTKFYAAFVELGTSKMAAMPYLRNALKRNRYRAKKLLQMALDNIY